MDTKPMRESGDRLTWLRWLFVPSVVAVGWSLGFGLAVLLVGLALLTSAEVIVSRFPNRRMMYACSLGVMLLAGVFTLGIVGDTKSVSSTVTGMWSQGGFGPEEYCVDVTCSEASSGKLSAILRKGDWERILREWTGTDDPVVPVELRYRTQSILGISSLEPVADAINSRLVIADYRQFPRGGILGRVALPVTLVLGALPLIYLVYMDRRELFGRLTRR